MPTGAPLIVLASASPARLATLRRAGLRPQVMVSDVDEGAIAAQVGLGDTAALVGLLARAKAEAVLTRRASRSDRADSELIVGCDSMLEIDGAALGKPGTPQIAVQRWRQMRGRTGILRTGHAVALTSGAVTRGAATSDAATGWRETAWAEGASSTEVRFADVSDAEIAAYVATGEPLSVAGAFTIDGLGGWFIESLHGDHHGVVGISLPLLRSLLGSLGISVPDLWNQPAPDGR